MATGGGNGDSPNEGLDLRELESELEAFGDHEHHITNESLSWEEQKAQIEYEDIEAETSSELDFPGFPTETTTPNKDYPSKFKSVVNLSVHSTPKTTQVHTDLYSKSVPTSPSKDWSSLNIQQRIDSFERISSFDNLSKAHHKQKLGAKFSAKFKTKAKASPKAKKSTRQTLKEGQVSPLAKATTLIRKRSKVRSYIRPINTMAQADISQAGRLNPRNRGIGGVGDTVASLGFPELLTASIPPAGKNVLREFIPLRADIVADANLVLADAGDATACKEILVDYLTDVSNLKERFNNVMEGIADENVNAEAAINEIIKIEGELQGLMRACKVRIANRVAPGAAAAPGDQVKLTRLPFPDFDGSGNFKTWRTLFDELAVHVGSEQTKKSHLLTALNGNAKTYISNSMTAASTFNDIMSMLENRYNDPLSVNYNLLNRVFNSPDLAKPQSTQAHWDSAVGDIKAIQESGLGIGEVLVYYRLHKFQPDIVRRLKDMHKIRYPGKPSINLNEAIDIMNKITAEEAALTEDTISVEQGVKSLTLTATPKVTQYIKSTPQEQFHSTYTPRTEGLSLQHGGAVSKGGYRGGKGWGGNNNTSGLNSGFSHNKPSPPPTQLYCYMCQADDHASFQCPKFATPSSKRAELVRIGRCPDCTTKLRPGMNSHRCPSYISCNQCNANHRRWLCTQSNNSTVSPSTVSPSK